MKLLFDQNISFRLITEIEQYFFGSKQVKEIGLENKEDHFIWEFAKKNDFAIVTFDADFNDIANIKGCPPKIIWIRSGNMTTKNLIALMKHHQSTIIEFLSNDKYKNISCLEIR